MKACHCFRIVYLLPPHPPKKMQAKRKKYLGVFKLSGPFDLNLCLQVQHISKLSIKNHLEEFGLLKASRPEAVGKILS